MVPACWTSTVSPSTTRLTTGSVGASVADTVGELTEGEGAGDEVTAVVSGGSGGRGAVDGGTVTGVAFCRLGRGVTVGCAVPLASATVVPLRVGLASVATAVGGSTTTTAGRASAPHPARTIKQATVSSTRRITLRSAIMGKKPSKLYYGWVMVCLLGLAELSSWGIYYYSFTVFVAPMEAELGWSRGAISAAWSIGFVVSGLAAVPVGTWLDRHGPRLLMAAGSIVGAALLLAWANVSSLLVFYAIWVGLGVVSAAVLYEPAFALIALWFRRYRSRALTLLTCLSGFASIVYVPLSGWLVESYGWRQALVVLGILYLAGTLPIHGLALRHRPEDIGEQPDGSMAPAEQTKTESRAGASSMTTAQAMRDPAFWWLTAAFSIGYGSIAALLVHLVPYLLDRGFDPAFAAAAGGLTGAMALPGRLLLTPLGDRVSRIALTVVIFLSPVLALPALLLVPGALGVYAFVVLMGIGVGTMSPARAGLMADFYGPAHYGAINGVMAAISTPARAAGPLLVGVFYDLTGGYAAAYWGVFAISIVAVAAIPIAARVRKRPTVPA